jgi:hypothetical protein
MAAAPAERTGTMIEALFRPTTRYRDSHRDDRHIHEGFTEVELLPGLAVENVRAMSGTWEDFRVFLRNKLVWMTPCVFIRSKHFHGIYYDSLVLELGWDVPDNSLLVYVTEGTPVYPTHAAATIATCDFLVRLCATSELPSVLIYAGDGAVPLPLSGAALSLFFQESRSCLRHVTLEHMVLSEDLCLALATMPRRDVELDIFFCSLSDGAAGAIVECLQSDRGPVELSCCGIDNQILASALAGKSRVTRLCLDEDATDGADMAVLFAALATNRGLLDLDLRDCSISDEMP